MLLRGRSKDRSMRKVTPPQPSYMSNEQFATYLTDLRTKRVERPNGARPLPTPKTPNRREIQHAQASHEIPLPVIDQHQESTPRTTSALSTRQKDATFSAHSTSSRYGRAINRASSAMSHNVRDGEAETATLLKPSMVVPSATYIERGQRWMEKEDAVALRDAMEDMELEKQHLEDAQLYAAAQEEASELVWQHQNGGEERAERPYRYKEHLRKNSYAHARTQSVASHGPVGMMTGLGRDIVQRSTSDGSVSADESSHHGQGMVHRSNEQVAVSPTKGADCGSGDLMNNEISQHNQKKHYYGLQNSSFPHRKRGTSGKRNISGELATVFSGEGIHEDPGEDAESMEIPAAEVPAPLRLKTRHPISKIQSGADLPPRSNSSPPVISKQLSRLEIHENLPSKYTANTPLKEFERSSTPVKNGLEVRSDDIRQATSMRRKDRSPKLPMPAIVSHKPGRPIVSFDPNWKPREADIKPAEEPQRARPEPKRPECLSETQSLPILPTTHSFPQVPIPSIQLPEPPRILIGRTPTNPSVAVCAAPMPEIVVNDIPSISISPMPEPTSPPEPISDLPLLSISGPPEPISDLPLISISGPPAICVAPASQSGKPSTTRPLPAPRHTPSKNCVPSPIPRGHWSPAPSMRATATCHQCELPIEGRVVAVKDLSQRFHPHCFICYTCGTSLEALEISPEPTEQRASRLDRIQRRLNGEHLDELDGQSMADDGDQRLRFYCHLDWHEHFAPRCKHCTTTIIGEHVVALGHHWHYGHFFCAECGDPFEQGMTHIEKDGYAWCLRCQTRRTERRAPKCRKCKGPVIGNYVQALGGEFHEECFRCAECDGAFMDGRIFEMGGEDRNEDKRGNAKMKTTTTERAAVCVACMERRWKA